MNDFYISDGGGARERKRKTMDFDLQPVLRGELVELRPLRDADFDGLFAVAADPLIWEQHPAADRWREEPFRAFFREAMESGGALIAIDQTDGRIIGSSRFHGYDAGSGEVEIGWTFLARSHWGGQYNGEMKQLMLDHAFRFVARVVFLIGPHTAARAAPWRRSAAWRPARGRTHTAARASSTGSPPPPTPDSGEEDALPGPAIHPERK